jgi:hypothetical protein
MHIKIPLALPAKLHKANRQAGQNMPVPIERPADFGLLTSNSLLSSGFSLLTVPYSLSSCIAE